MALVAVVLAGIWVVCLWFQMVHYLPALRAITGCRHTRGRTVETVPDSKGRMSAVTWCCNDCPFQVSPSVSRVGYTVDGRPAFAVIKDKP